ncbi:MAG: hypothetical protein ACKO4T_12390 [Planctomycetaceae bacterium]
MSSGRVIRLAAVVAGLAVVWCGFLPWIGRCRVIERHVAAMESRGVNPAAMVYTELERLPVRPRWVETRVMLWP